MIPDRRLALAAVVGFALILAAAISDFFTKAFWEHHALLTSLIANLLIVGVTVVVINAVFERRDRKRWNLLAQSVLFALIQSARATWTGMIEALQLGEVQSGAIDSLNAAAEVARDTQRVSEAARALLEDEERMARFQRMCVALSEHAAQVIAAWAPVMLGAGPYAEHLDRHVELAARLEWLSGVLVHNEPPPNLDRRDRVLTRSSVASEYADTLGSDDWLHDQILAVISLAVTLDYESRTYAYQLAPMSWWAERTVGLAASD
jgi:hypothetical protein